MSDQTEPVIKRGRGRPRKKPVLLKSEDPAYILNPKSNKWVLKTGVVGLKLKKQMTRTELSEHIRVHSVDTMLRNRNLLRSDLSDEELKGILIKLVDMKLISNNIPVLSGKPAKPKQVVSSRSRTHPPDAKPVAKPAAKQKRKVIRRKHRFVVRDPPPMPDTTDAETAYDDTTAYEDQSDSESDSE